MILSNKLAKGKPKKNLIPDWTSDRWFQDSTVAGGTPILDVNNPYKMKFSMTQPAQARLIWIPVELGKAYTFSFANMTGVYRLYKGKVTAHGGTVLVQDSTPKPFTFVVDSAYNGFVTLRITQGWAGTFWFENLQLEEGYSVTKFEPYQELAKASKKVPRISLINSNPSNWIQGVRQQSLDISASNYRITFNASFPKVRPNRTYKLTFKYGYKFGVFLFDKDGKMLLDSKWQYSDYTFTTPSNEGVTVTLNGGLSNDGALTPSRIADSGMMLYDVTDLMTKPANLVPKKNLIPMDLSKWQIRANTTNVKFDGTKISWEASQTYGGVNFFLDPLTYAGKTITFSRGTQNGGASAIAFYKTSDGTQRYMALDVTNSLRVDVPKNVVELRYYVQNATEAIKGKTYWVTDLQAELSSTATPYSNYELAPKPAVVSNVKAPYKNYPFSFKRESVEILDGVQYGYNNPRIKGNGLFVEEGTINLFSGRNFNSNNGTTMVDLGDRVKLTGLTDGNSSGGYIAGITVKSNTTYTISAKFKEGDSAIDKLNFLAEQSGAGTIRRKPFKIGERYYMTFTTSASVTKVNICFYLSGGKAGDYFELYKDWQIEEKAYTTSYTDKERKNEVATSKVNIDKYAGAIEVEFEYSDVESKSQYIYDTDSGRFILYKDAWDNTFYVYLDSTSVISLPKSVIPSGKVKARVEWKDGIVSLFLNDVKVGTGSYPQSDFIASRNIYFGSRFTMVEHLNNLIYSFKIEDRNGYITYKI